MRLILRYTIFSFLLLCLFANKAKAQRINTDTVQSPGLRIGLDVSSFGYRYLYPNNREHQISLDAGYKHFYLVTEYGRAAITNNQPGFDYEANGYFSRNGFDYNILKGEDMIFVGSRYAFSRFTDRFDKVVLNDPYYGDYSPFIGERKIRASWFEAVGGVKVRVWGNLAIGFTGRYLLKIRATDGDFSAHRIPGYGLATNPTNFRFDYYISYKIPVLKPLSKLIKKL